MRPLTCLRALLLGMLVLAVRPAGALETALLEDLRKVFEADAGTVRLVMLLSPT